MNVNPRARRKGIITEAVGDELVVYVESTKAAHALSAEAASVWKRCDGQRSANEIPHSVGLTEARVAQALDELSAAELIERPDGISRRALYQRMAKLGAAAFSAPLIYSVALPTASAAQSPISACGDSLGQSCQVIWDNDTCDGSPAEDECSFDAGTACTCQNLGPCQNVAIEVSVRRGTCR